MDDFIAELSTVFHVAERGHLALVDADGTYRGFIQLLWGAREQITIHRLWTLERGKGHGSVILGTLCRIADRHGVELTLKVMPIGRKPYPMTRDALVAWYQRHGFEGTRRKMVRKPQSIGANQLKAETHQGGARE